eukprot:UN01511
MIQIFKFVPRQKVLAEDTSLLETLGNKIQALAWVIAAVAIWYYTDLWNIIKTAFVSSETTTSTPTDIVVKQLNFIAFYFALFLATIAGIAGGIVVIDIYKKRDGVGDEKICLKIIQFQFMLQHLQVYFLVFLLLSHFGLYMDGNLFLLYL